MKGRSAATEERAGGPSARARDYPVITAELEDRRDGTGTVAPRETAPTAEDDAGAPVRLTADDHGKRTRKTPSEAERNAGAVFRARQGAGRRNSGQLHRPTTKDK